MEKPPKLDRPDPGLSYALQTDASDHGMGAVLFQIGKDGQRRIISFASAKFKPAESRYHFNEQECLAVIWAIRRYHVYLEDCPFTLRTDSKALTWLDQMKDTKKKLTQWASYLSRLKFTVEHCPGKENELADALSRHPAHDAPCPGEPDLEIMLPSLPESGDDKDHVAQPRMSALRTPSLFELVREAQQNDPMINREVERWNELRNLPRRNTCEERYV